MQIAPLTMNPALDVTTDTPALIAGHKLGCAPPREEAILVSLWARGDLLVTQRLSHPLYRV